MTPPSQTDVPVNQDNLERFGFRAVACGIMTLGRVDVFGPPATGNVDLWTWKFDSQTLPRILRPRTMSDVELLFEVMREFRKFE